MAPPARAEAIPPAIAPNIITSLKWLETNNLFNNLIQRNQSAAFSSGKVRPNHETNINIIARRTGKDVNSHTVLDGIITTIMATIQRINIIGSREGSRNRRRLKANQTGKKYQIKEMTRKVSAEVDLVHQQTQNQRYGSSHIGATAKDISNVVTDAASGVVDIFHGIDKAVADTWNNFWKDGKADGIGSNLSRK